MQSYKTIEWDIGVKNAHAYLRHEEVLALYEKVLSGKEFDSTNAPENVKKSLKNFKVSDIECISNIENYWDVPDLAAKHRQLNRVTRCRVFNSKNTE